ncbi:Thoeris anti-defense Tad2 family protein [Rhizobium sp. 768_B6_N1_8]|uniref:Thoeris anti-defense Tad2 family protein n=1 Tax=unclassified Rhizobium TaxID=2613769 RepID=UPI003F23962F
MNYGEAIEAMKAGHTVGRTSNRPAAVYISHPGTSLQYLEVVTDGVRKPYAPTTDDQLAEDWVASTRWAIQDAEVAA